MKAFMILFFITVVFAASSTPKANPFQCYISQKANLRKSEDTGHLYNPVLKTHGSGITDGQQTMVLNYVDQASILYGEDINSNAVFIQQKVEDSLSGRWIVQILGGNPSWGRATHIRNDKWILFIGYGANGWDYVIWAPEC